MTERVAVDLKLFGELGERLEPVSLTYRHGMDGVARAPSVAAGLTEQRADSVSHGFDELSDGHFDSFLSRIISNKARQG